MKSFLFITVAMFAGCVEPPTAIDLDAEVPDSGRPDVAGPRDQGEATDIPTNGLTTDTSLDAGTDATADVGPAEDATDEPDLSPPNSCGELEVPLGRWDMTGNGLDQVPNTGSGDVGPLELDQAVTQGTGSDANLVLQGDINATPHVPHAPALDLQEGTVTMWFVPHADILLSGRSAGLFSKDALGQNDNGHLSISSAGTTLQVRQQGPVAELQMSDPRPLVPDQWTHVAYTWRDGRVELYRDGELAVSLEQGWGIDGNPNPIAIGFSSQRSEDGSHLPAETPFKGMIDDVMIWDRVLGAAEVELLAQAECVVPSQ